MEMLLILLGLVVFDLAASRWGARSIEDVDSAEWARRKAWRGFSAN
jgi:hypothetical protein